MKKFKRQEKKWDRNKPRPYIIESRWKEGTMNRDWKFFRAFTKPELALEAVETNLCKAKFIEYRLMLRGVEQWVK